MENAAFNWFEKNKKNVLYGGIIAIFLLFFTYRTIGGGTSHDASEYFAAEKAFQAFVDKDKDLTETQREDAFNQLKSISKRYPDIGLKYDAPIAQMLLNENKVDEAKMYAEKVFSRTKKNELPEYDSFSETTLLIAERNDAQALQNAKLLQTQLNAEAKETHFFDRLYAYNMMRIAFLEEALGENKASISSFEALEDYLYGDSISSEARQFFENLFLEGDVSLKSFIQAKKSSLNRSLEFVSH